MSENVNTEFNMDELNESLGAAPATAQVIPPVAKFIDPEDDRDNWPVIQVDHVDQLGNFHFISVGGTKTAPTNPDGSPKIVPIKNGDGTPKMDEMGNPQFITALGKPFQHDLKIMRGVDVAVPPSVVHMLQDTKKTKYHQTTDPVTGRSIMQPRDVPPIPWHLVEKGKYIK